VVWLFGPAPTGLADAVRTAGAHVEEWAGDPLADLVRVHRVAEKLALARGLDPDHPRNLTRSVILP
jgi:fructoselysine-6-P-deglycase FrlB-like protein